MSILLFVNLKGGVAKTTNAVAVAECLAESGYRTLLIDADHQCMSGELLLGENRLLKCEGRKMTLHDMMGAMLDDEFESEQFDYFAVKNASDIGDGLPKLSVIPCSIRIDDFSTNMAKARRGHKSNDEFLAMFGRRREGVEPYNRLPRPFKTIIPNAAKIAEATEPDRRPRNFNAKYTPEFARLYRGLCEEIVQRSQWPAEQTTPAKVAVIG
jgi:cellulose biosynthesis protein BcsQ